MPTVLDSVFIPHGKKEGKGKEAKTYQAASPIDARIACPHAIQPLGLSELPETFLLHRSL